MARPTTPFARTWGPGLRTLTIYLVAAVGVYVLAHRRLESEREASAATARRRWESIRKLGEELGGLDSERARLIAGESGEARAGSGEPAVADHAEATRLWLELHGRGAFTTVSRPAALTLDASGRLPPEFASLFELSGAVFDALRDRVAGLKLEIDRIVTANATVRPGADGTMIIEVKADPAAAGLRAQLEDALRQALGPADYEMLVALQKVKEPSSLMNARRSMIEYYGDEPRTFTVTRNAQSRGYNLLTRNPTAGLTLTEMPRPSLEKSLGPLAGLLPAEF